MITKNKKFRHLVFAIVMSLLLIFNVAATPNRSSNLTYAFDETVVRDMAKISFGLDYGNSDLELSNEEMLAVAEEWKNEAGLELYDPNGYFDGEQLLGDFSFKNVGVL